jgi:methyl-accepting chemotaxis protein
MMMAAMWFQGMDTFSDDNTKILLVFVGLVALAMVVQAIALIVIAAKSSKAIEGLTATIDELKQKTLPLIDSATQISRGAETLLRENAPKVRTIADNLVETSDKLVDASSAARAAVQQFDVTIADVNRRAQKQVARVDEMVTATLATTAEIAETISNGVRVPVQIIASIAGQAKTVVEGALAAVKAFAAGLKASNR